MSRSEISLAATLIAAYKDGTKIADRIKKKRVQKGSAPPPQELEKALRDGEVRITEVRDENRDVKVDLEAQMALKDLIIEVQGTLLHQLVEAEQDDSFDDFTEIIQTAVRTRRRAINVLNDLYQRTEDEARQVPVRAQADAEAARAMEEGARKQQLMEEDKRKQRLTGEGDERKQQLTEEGARRRRLMEEDEKRQRLIEEDERKQRLIEEDERKQRLIEDDERKQRLIEEDERKQRLMEDQRKQRLMEDQRKQRLMEDQRMQRLMEEDEAKKWRLHDNGPELADTFSQPRLLPADQTIKHESSPRGFCPALTPVPVQALTKNGNLGGFCKGAWYAQNLRLDKATGSPSLRGYGWAFYCKKCNFRLQADVRDRNHPRFDDRVYQTQATRFRLLFLLKSHLPLKHARDSRIYGCLLCALAGTSKRCNGEDHLIEHVQRHAKQTLGDTYLDGPISIAPDGVHIESMRTFDLVFGNTAVDDDDDGTGGAQWLDGKEVEFALPPPAELDASEPSTLAATQALPLRLPGGLFDSSMSSSDIYDRG
ncbi:hypothetical protein DV737_g1158, partial [Chaetothyriales sp. CBS 132003]